MAAGQGFDELSRRAMRASVLSTSATPAMQAAVCSPMLCPIVASAETQRMNRRATAHSMTNRAGWVSRSRPSIVAASAARPGSAKSA